MELQSSCEPAFEEGEPFRGNDTGRGDAEPQAPGPCGKPRRAPRSWVLLGWGRDPVGELLHFRGPSGHGSGGPPPPSVRVPQGCEQGNVCMTHIITLSVT